MKPLSLSSAIARPTRREKKQKRDVDKRKENDVQIPKKKKGQITKKTKQKVQKGAKKEDEEDEMYAELIKAQNGGLKEDRRRKERF